VPSSRGRPWGGSQPEPPQPPMERPTPPNYDDPADANSPPRTGTGAPRANQPGPAPPRGRPAPMAPASATGARPRGVPVVQLDADEWLPWFDMQSSRWFGP